MKNIKWIGFVAMAMLVAATLACGGGGTTEAPTSAPPPTAQPTTVTTGTASLTVVNNSGVDVWYLYVSPSSSSTWGNDQLGSSILHNGESFTVTGLPYDTYDIRAEDSNQEAVIEEYGVEIRGNVTWTIGPGEQAGMANLEVVNNSGVDVWYLYISPSSSTEWGEDQLGATILYNGDRFTVTDLPYDTYDIKAEDSNHNVVGEVYSFVIDQDTTWTITGAALSGGPRQWAISAVASSEFSTPSWSAMQATGAPDTTGCGDYSTAWASETSDGEDWIELTYATPTVPSQINIYETHSPGFIIRVQVIDMVSSYHVVWEGQPRPTTECPRIFSINVEGIDFPVAGIRITLDQRNGGNWNEIDAVELVGTPAE